MLAAMGYPADEARGALRVSLGRTTTDAEVDEACRVVPAVLRRLIAATPVVAPGLTWRRDGRRASPEAPGSSPDEPDPRRDVRRRGQLGCGGAAPRAGPRGRRASGCASTTWRTAYSEFRRSCCSADAADDARRVAARLGHPVLRHEPRARVRGRRHRAVRGRLPRRPDPQPVRGLQHRRQVRRAPRPGAPPLRLRGRGHRPLRAPHRRGLRRRPARPSSPGPPTRPRTRPTSCTASARTSSWHSRFPLGDLTKPEVRERRARPRPRHRRQAREPGDLLRAGRRLPRRAARRAAAGGPVPGPVVDADGRWSASTAATAGFTVGQRKGLGVALGEPRYVSRIDAGDQRHRPRASRGPRDDRDRARGRHVRRRSAARRSRCADGAWRPFRAQVRIRHRAPLVGCPRPTGVARRARARRPLDRRDGQPGVGDRARPGLRPLRRRCVPRRRPDRRARACPRRAHGPRRPGAGVSA